MTSSSEETVVFTPRPPAVKINTISVADVKAALIAGWRDFLRAPLIGLFFGGIYAAGGIAIFLLLKVYHEPWWIIPIAVGFPLIGPFVAVGLYETSRRIAAGEPLNFGQILMVILAQRKRQVAWMAFAVLFIFWMWLYEVRMLLAVFLGFKSFSSIEAFFNIVTTTPEGIGFLLVGTGVGAFISFVLFCTTVVGIPLLLDREIDLVTGIIYSFKAVLQNPAPMIGFGILVVALTFAAFVPVFLGLLVVLPVLGHATWHLYKAVVAE
ncbi:MAG: DUF2189 domain-containing protein [Aestuariivirga sp.]|uniref:DUF2189 domain-containing protein n=1 Tax=Aestuariivirga sp. TaxID=2650926 RepID=UPI0025C48438|nr:DUF2189 domain-containing protein [Aestuariivirga sp.]MCA3561229.1 DUF2189 domain-containing protein [Aestuariivirga sp.]